MKFVFLTLIFSALAGCTSTSNSPAAKDHDENEIVQAKLQAEILGKNDIYQNLTELTQIGPRLNGSDGAAKAVAWAKQKMESYGFDRVWLQPVKLAKWERGATERASAILKNQRVNLRVTALGSSVGTPGKGIDAPVIEVHGVDEVAKLGEQAKGKIIFYNRPMDPVQSDTFVAYDGAIDQRWDGAKTASKVGAVGVIVRSLNPSIDDHPHTGMMDYEDAKKIPAAAISTKGAETLSQLLKQQPDLHLHLELSAHPAGTADTFNVIGELKGAELPNEYVIVGGHLDSWDLAQGTHDDGTGVVQSIEVLRSMHALGLRPRRTVRVVLFMGEEMGGETNGAHTYANEVKAKNEKHIAALESDRGGFTPLGFSVSGGDANVQRLRSWGKYLAPLHADMAWPGEGDVDTGKLKALGVTLFSFIPDSQRYFDYHHAETDKLEAVNPRELKLGAAAMSTLIWLIADKGL